MRTRSDGFVCLCKYFRRGLVSGMREMGCHLWVEPRGGSANGNQWGRLDSDGRSGLRSVQERHQHKTREDCHRRCTVHTPWTLNHLRHRPSPLPQDACSSRSQKTRSHPPHIPFRSPHRLLCPLQVRCSLCRPYPNPSIPPTLSTHPFHPL